MKPMLHFGGLLLAAALCGYAEQGGARGGRAPGPPPRNPGAGAFRGGGTPKAGPRFTNPANPVARLFRTTPDQRDRVLEKLPQAQQERARQLLAWYDRLPKAQQEIVLQRQERWDSLPPERRREVQQSIRALQSLTPERRQAVNQAFRRLQTMPEDQRTQVLNSDQFKSRFSPDEQKIVLDLSEIILPPQ
jgi:hypothetical protein